MTLPKLPFPAGEGEALNTTRSDHAEPYAATSSHTAGPAATSRACIFWFILKKKEEKKEGRKKHFPKMFCFQCTNKDTKVP